MTRRPSVRVHAQRAAALHELAQLVAHQLAAPAVGHADVVAVLAAAQRADQGGQLGLGRDQLHGHAGLHRAVAHQRLRERDERGVAGVARRRLGGWGRRGRASGRGRSRASSASRAPVERLRRQAADLLEAVLVARGAPGELHERLVGQHRAGGAVGASRLVLAPLRQLERHAARASR